MAGVEVTPLRPDDAALLQMQQQAAAAQQRQDSFQLMGQQQAMQQAMQQVHLQVSRAVAWRAPQRLGACLEKGRFCRAFDYRRNTLP
jgi:hypothetical protein